MAVSSTLSSVISRLRDLPPLPKVATEVLRLLGDDRTTTAELAKLISGEPSLALKVLRIANSPFYGLSRQVKSLDHAIVVLGQRAIGTLVLAAATIGQLQPTCGPSSGRYAHEVFWQHSVLTGVCARRIAEKLSRDALSPHDAFLFGLLHDIGELALVMFAPEDLALVAEYERGHPESSGYDAEQAVLGFDHQTLGAELLRRWDLPSLCVQVAEQHHRHLGNEEGQHAETIVVVVQIADMLGTHLQHTLADYSETVRQAGASLQTACFPTLDLQGLSAAGIAQPMIESLVPDLSNLLDESFSMLRQMRS
jgi:putative nucleotidyltransferase with HDIG domain